MSSPVYLVMPRSRLVWLARTVPGGMPRVARGVVDGRDIGPVRQPHGVDEGSWRVKEHGGYVRGSEEA
jgi:hypothetical protein